MALPRALFSSLHPLSHSLYHRSLVDLTQCNALVNRSAVQCPPRLLVISNTCAQPHDLAPLHKPHCALSLVIHSHLTPNEKCPVVKPLLQQCVVREYCATHLH